ncbi:hypothetical protein CB1_000726055 [Camelus ferus]|nr:hypothetical protein CB1_000726055 [Camelus ferus]
MGSLYGDLPRVTALVPSVSPGSSVAVGSLGVPFGVCRSSEYGAATAGSGPKGVGLGPALGSPTGASLSAISAPVFCIHFMLQ